MLKSRTQQPLFLFRGLIVQLMDGNIVVENVVERDGAIFADCDAHQSSTSLFFLNHKLSHLLHVSRQHIWGEIKRL
jgi:hypothetical protein